MSTPIRHVSDTALWVAIYRAMESERPDALFRDPFARRMAGERGEAIVAAMPKGRSLAWPMIVRTAVLDEIIVRLVGQGVATVVNLAAGLDTRAFRLPQPRDLRWVDVDLPDMIAYREEHLAGAAAVCRHENVAADLTDAAARRSALERATAGAARGSVLVVTEGLLVYLERDQVAELARDLAARPEIRWWLIDLASPMLLQFLERTWGRRLEQSGTPMKFAPAEGTAFFAPLGWREVEFRSTWHESLRLHRSAKGAWLWNILGRLQPKHKREAMEKMSGMVLLERA